MTDSISSAEPQKLFRYSDAGARIDRDLDAESRRLAGKLQHFEAVCTEERVPVSHLSSALAGYAGQTELVDVWVRRVGVGFQMADSLSWLNVIIGPGNLQRILLPGAGDRVWALPVAIVPILRRRFGIPWPPRIIIRPPKFRLPSWIRLPKIGLRPQPAPKPVPSEQRKVPETPARSPLPIKPQPRTFKPPTDKDLSSIGDYYKFGVHYGSGLWSGKPHPGIDVDGVEGEQIHPIGSGKIVKIGNDSPQPPAQGYGHYVVVEHELVDGQKIYSIYAHLQKRPDIKIGDPINSDSVIGNMGRSGNQSQTHLHLEVRTRAGFETWRTYKDLNSPNWQDYWLDPAKVVGSPAYETKSV